MFKCVYVFVCTLRLRTAEGFSASPSYDLSSPVLLIDVLEGGLSSHTWFGLVGQ